MMVGKFNGESEVERSKCGLSRTKQVEVYYLLLINQQENKCH